jgi:hypothetical protein
MVTSAVTAQESHKDNPIGAEEAEPTLFKLSRTDNSVTLLLQGSWEAGLNAQGGVALTELGLQAAATNNPLLLTQRVDLTLRLWIRDHWFIEASFLDNYDLNTYRAGYQGSEDDKLQYLGVGNTGLDFPNFPYLNLGGSSASSFGLYNKWQFNLNSSERTDSQTSQMGHLTLHGILRYDGAKLEEKWYAGTREITHQNIELSEMLRGYSFVLPDENLDTVPVLYIEDPSGTYIDENNGRWRLAKPSEYAASVRDGIIEITSPSALSAGRRLAVAYSKGGTSNPWTSSLGTYGDTTTAGSGFLGSVQAVFNAASSTKIALRDYPQPGQKDATKLKTDTNIPATVTINSTACLVIWEAGTFSPFERLSRYRIQSGTSSTVKLVSTADGQESRDFAIEPVLSSHTATEGSSTHSESSLYELVQTGTAYELRSPESRWPLVQSHPELYLPASMDTSLDLQILVTTYGSPGTLSIGTDVLPGSVQVYRNGLPDPLATYNAENGEVLLSSPPAEQEQIRIVYLKRSEERRFGSLSAGIGAQYKSGGPFSADLALGLRWNVSPDAFSEKGTTSPGTLGLSGKLAWDWEQLKIQTTAGLFYRQEDTTGLYRALGMEGSPYAEPFPSSGFYQSPVPQSLNDTLSPSPSLTADNQAQLLYRAYTSTDILGISTLHSIDWSGAELLPNKTGPYLVSDSTLDTPVLVGEANYTNEKIWAGFQLPMDQASSALAGARHITIPFRFYDVPASLGEITVKLYLQIGALDGSTGTGQSTLEAGLTGWENPNLVLTVPLFDSSSLLPGASLPTQWQTATLTLSDADRRALTGARAMRLVVVTSGITGTLRTRVLLGPPVVSGTSMRPIVVRGDQPLPAGTMSTGQIDATETIDSSLRDRYKEIIDKLHPDGAPQRILEVSFSGLGLEVGNAAGVDSRISVPSLSNYRNLSFFVRGPKAANESDQTALQSGTLTLLIAGGLARFSSPLLRVEIPTTAFIPNQWSKVDIAYNSFSPQVRIDGAPVPGAAVTFNPCEETGNTGTGSDGTYQYLALFLSPSDTSNSFLPDGSFAIDEILFTDPLASFLGRSGLYVQWEQKGPALSLGKVPILSDLKLVSASEGLYQSPIEAPYPANFGNLKTQSSVHVTVLGLITELRGGFSQNANSSSWNGGHRLTLPLALAEVGDNFDITENSFMHQSSVQLDTAKVFKSDTKGMATLSAQVSQEALSLKQIWNYTLDGRRKRFFIGSMGDLTYNRIPDGLFSNWDSPYSQTWISSWERLMPDLGTNAQNRTWNVQAKTGIEGQILGVTGATALSSRAVQNLQYTEQRYMYSVSLPFSFNTLKGSIKNQRETRQNNNQYGKDVEADASSYERFINSNLDILLLAPGYALYTPQLQGMLLQSGLVQGDILKKLSFTDMYSLDLQAPPPPGPWGLLVPAQTQIKVQRTAEQNLSSYTDRLSWETTLGSSATNLFGAYGQNPLFSFYRDDEFTQQFNLSLSWVDETLSEWKTSLQQRAAFYGFSSAQFDVSHTININQSGWSDALGLAWTHPALNSLVGFLFRSAVSSRALQTGLPGLAELAESPTELLQRERMDTKLDVTTTKVLDISISHESILRIKNRLNVTAFGKVSYSTNLTQNSFTLTGSTGTTIKIQF